MLARKFTCEAIFVDGVTETHSKNAMAESSIWKVPLAPGMEWWNNSELRGMLALATSFARPLRNLAAAVEARET